MSDMVMLMVKALILGAIVTGVLGFVFIKVVSKSTETHVTRLNRETESVRTKQTELNQKIKEASEELQKRRQEADALVAKMKEDAALKAQEEREKLIKKARSESEEIIIKAQKTKDDMRKALEQEVELKAIDFMVILAGEVFSDRVRAVLNRELSNEFLDSLQKVDMSMVGGDIDEAQVSSAIALDQDLQDRLSDIINKKLGRKISLVLSEDPKLLAGLIIRFNSLALDGSLANIMKEKGVEMKERLERGLL